jgi:hypothetical protein
LFSGWWQLFGSCWQLLAVVGSCWQLLAVWWLVVAVAEWWALCGGSGGVAAVERAGVALESEVTHVQLFVSFVGWGAVSAQAVVRRHGNVC